MVEKLADKLAEWCKVNYVLYEGQMDSRRQRSAIDAIAHVVGRVQKACSEEKLASILLRNIKEAFDHVGGNCLLCTLVGMRVDGDHMRWTE